MSSNELVEQIMAQVIARVATPEQTVTPDTPQTNERRLWQENAV